MVSRRHAVLHVSPDGVRLEDLGSRNGVLVNGIRMFESVPLHHGDKILIGNTEIYLVEASRRRREDVATRPLNVAAFSSNPSPGPMPRSSPRPSDDWESETTSRGSVYEVLVSAAERALRQQDLREGEAAVRNLLLSVRAALLRRQPPDDSTMSAVAGFALHMADLSGDPSWLDRLFDVLVTGRRVPDDIAVERLARLIPRLGLGGGEAVRAYVARIGERMAELDDDARRRLDNLAQVIDHVGT